MSNSSTTPPPRGRAEQAVPNVADVGNSMALLVDEPSATVMYTCEAAAGTAVLAAAWRISKTTVTGSVTQTTWAGADAASCGAFDQVANDRATLNYF